MNIIPELASMTDGTLILTSTERVARRLKQSAALLQAAAGQKAWFTKGKIQTITSWIESTWLALMPDEQLLFPVQELAMVKSVIDQSGLLPANMISSTSAARRVGQAYSSVYKYEIPIDRERFAFRAEYEAFFQWKGLLDAACAAKQCVFRAHLPGLLLKAIQAGEVVVPETIAIVGMTKLNPAEEAVFRALEAAGCTLRIVSTVGEKATPTLVRAHNSAAEFAEVAQWVSKQLKPYVETPLAAPQLAILVPDIRTYQAPLLDALSLHASPGSLLPSGPGGESRAPWDISSGESLGSRPVIRSAMDILSITPSEADPEAFSRVLRSQWIAGEVTESSSRAMVDVWLRDNMGMNMSGTDFLRAIGAYKGDAVPDFRKRYAGYLEALMSGEMNRYPSEWADQFNQSLIAMGWPGEREVDSATFQTLKAWDEALMLFRTLDAQLGTVQYERAYMWLREIVDTRQFQPRIAHVAPVSILGYEDAIGLNFDAVWVVGAANTVLPSRMEPSPFIPVELQVAAGILEASSDGALEHAQVVTSSLLSVSDKVTVSCAHHNEKGAAIGASELFGSWPAPTERPASKGDFLDQLLGGLNRAVFAEEEVPAVTADELSTLKGGVQIFKDFAEEPFFAFARNRLGATPFPEPVVGLDPRIQGTMVHLVLELFWREVKTSWNLKSFGQEDLYSLVASKVAEASEKLLNKLGWRYGQRLIVLEQRRLSSLCVEWLELEKQRTLEFEVIAFEEPFDITIGEVALTVKMDRRDRVYLDADRTEYREIVHDYKTGSSMRMTSLNATSMTEPQLPIYATQPDYEAKGIKPISGISLAQVNLKSLGFHVRSDFTAALLPGEKTNSDAVNTEEKWAAQCEAWDKQLHEMSEDFMAGVADLVQSGKALPMGYEYLAPLAR
ncbi:PD-(D/E)XK nuclease family protein [Pseudomonas sp. NCHU5208]|uniref:PD-(D/E)XK nuclease family protein n=1 Tax=unclassified Pseudomonas TaxID=196821 RepID=UPI003F967C24